MDAVIIHINFNWQWKISESLKCELHVSRVWSCSSVVAAVGHWVAEFLRSERKNTESYLWMFY